MTWWGALHRPEERCYWVRVSFHAFRRGRLITSMISWLSAKRLMLADQAATLPTHQFTILELVPIWQQHRLLTNSPYAIRPHKLVTVRSSCGCTLRMSRSYRKILRRK